MTVIFDIEIADIMAFQKHYLETNHSVRRSKRMVTYIFPVVIMLVCAAMLAIRPHDTSTMLITIAYFAFLAAAWIFIMPRWTMKMWLKKALKTMSDPQNAIYFGKRELTFDDNEIIIKTAESEEKSQWSIFRKIYETTEYFFMYVSTNNAMVIPKKKISAAQVEDLRKLFRTHIKEKQV